MASSKDANIFAATPDSSSKAEISEKLYVDSYFRLLKSKDSDFAEAKNVLRDMIQQINIHCINQNLSETGSENLKSELVTEYFNIVDNENHPGLLPVVNDNGTKGIKHSLTTSEHYENTCRMKHSLRELNSYLGKLIINSPLEQPQSSEQSRYNPKTVNSNKLNIYNQSSSSASFQKYSPSPQFKSCATVLSSKRTAEDSNTGSGQSAKRYYNSRVCTKLKAQVKSSIEQSKASVSGFVSVSSMYRNPLKTVTKEEKQKADDKDSQICNDESLKRFDKKIVDVIFNEIMDFSPNIKWSDIAGLDFVKTTVQEIVIWPLLRPDIFTGLRAPPRGILLFGPPGTGKTLIGKCIATESNSTFFCISASSLASKWVGESEQLVRALFTLARLNQPSVIFIDEIDSLLSQRSDKDQDFTRKLKTEFLVQFDGAKTDAEERILVVGATNRPHELDEAARRRFVKRLYVPLPEESGRRQIVQKLLIAHQHNLSDSDLQRICDETKGYSGSDVAHLCKEAAMGPIRCIGPESIKTVSLDQVRSIMLNDFLDALRQVRASVAQDDLNYYLQWNKKFGSFGVNP